MGTLRPILFFGILFSIAASGRAAPAVAENLPYTPSVCVGYDSETNSWGGKKIDNSVPENNCPKDHAFVGAIKPTGPNREGKYIAILGFCCALPLGALSEEHTFAESVCPDGFVATGLKLEVRTTAGQTPDRVDLLRCTKVDSLHYSLGEVEKGQQLDLVDDYLAIQRSYFLSRFFPEYTARINWSNLPAGIRYAIGRVSLTSWDWGACIGNPVGSLLTGKEGKYCNDLQFRVLRQRFSQMEHDTPVVLFPACSAIDDIFSPQAACVSGRK